MAENSENQEANSSEENVENYISKMEELVQKQLKQTEQLIADTHKKMEEFTPFKGMDEKSLYQQIESLQEKVDKALTKAVKACDDRMEKIAQAQSGSA